MHVEENQTEEENLAKMGLKNPKIEWFLCLSMIELSYKYSNATSDNFWPLLMNPSEKTACKTFLRVWQPKHSSKYWHWNMRQSDIDITVCGQYSHFL